MSEKNCFIINGCKRLYGEVINQTSKNATLPILSASLIVNGDIKIVDYPEIIDIDNMLMILKKMGARVEKVAKNLIINTENADNLGIDSELSRTMRSSIFLLGSTLARFKNVMLTLPGGCQIGKRPIDIHISAMKQLGVKVCYLGNNIFFDASKAKAGNVKLRKPSVGATENIIQFACKLKGKTEICNPAREPEVVDLCNFLNSCGAKILGAGTDKISIYGVDELIATIYKPIGDRIVAGTIVGAVAICGGDVVIRNAVPYQNLKFLKKVCSMGCQIDIKNDIIHIVSDGNLISCKEISTGYYPNFPTDLQSIILAISAVANGETVIKENIFENRFLILSDLLKLGGKFKHINNKTVKIRGVNKLEASQLIANDLRGGASLVLLALKAKGESKITNIHHIDRGYEHLEEMLAKLGADIRRL